MVWREEGVLVCREEGELVWREEGVLECIGRDLGMGM